MAECQELLRESATETEDEEQPIDPSPAVPEQPKVVVGGKARKLPGCELLDMGGGSYRVFSVYGCLYVRGKTQVLHSEGCGDERDRIFKFHVADNRWSEVTTSFADLLRDTIVCLSDWPDQLSIYFVSVKKDVVRKFGDSESVLVPEPNGETSHVWRFDCNAETMSKVMTCKVPKEAESGLYAIGGRKTFLIGTESIFEMDLDITVVRWEKVADLPGGHRGVDSASWVNGSVYMIKQPGNTLRYDDVMREVSELKPLEGGDFLPGAQIVSDGDLIMSLASRDGLKEASLVVLDPCYEESGWQWLEAASLPPHLFATGIAFEKGSVYAIGRWRHDQRCSEMREVELTRSQLRAHLRQEGSDLNGQVGDATTLPSSPPGAQELKVRDSAQDPNEGTGDASALAGPLDDYARLLSSGEFADVRFLVGGERQAVKGHVAIVSSRCPVLASLIKDTKLKKDEETKGSMQVDHNVQCCHHLEVVLPEIEALTFNQTLQFVYLGRVERAEGHDVCAEMQLYDAAAFLHLEGLRKECADNLGGSTRVDEFIDRLQMASTLSLDFAQRFYVDEIVHHKRYMEIAGSQNFCCLGPELILKVVLEYGRLHGGRIPDDAEPAECLEAPE